MKDFYVITDNQDNYCFYDNVYDELKFDDKVPRRSGMFTDLDKAKETLEKFNTALKERVQDMNESNNEIQARPISFYGDISEKCFNNIKANQRYTYNEFVTKELSIMEIKHIKLDI